MTGIIQHIEVYVTAIKVGDVIFNPQDSTEFKVLSKEWADMPGGGQVIGFHTDKGPLARYTSELVTMNVRPS